MVAARLRRAATRVWLPRKARAKRGRGDGWAAPSGGGIWPGVARDPAPGGPWSHRGRPTARAGRALGVHGSGAPPARRYAHRAPPEGPREARACGRAGSAKRWRDLAGRRTGSCAGGSLEPPGPAGRPPVPAGRSVSMVAARLPRAAMRIGLPRKARAERGRAEGRALDCVPPRSSSRPPYSPPYPGSTSGQAAAVRWRSAMGQAVCRPFLPVRGAEGRRSGHAERAAACADERAASADGAAACANENAARANETATRAEQRDHSAE